VKVNVRIEPGCLGSSTFWNESQAGRSNYMAKSRHNGAFIVGSVLGGAVGALTALWKTPQSGAELRARLGLAPDAAVNVSTTAKSATAIANEILSDAVAIGKPLPGKALGLVESAMAPLVGVKLGQTANNSQPQPGEAGTLTVVDEQVEVGVVPVPVMPQGSK
jgi:gas vesicle protein